MSFKGFLRGNTAATIVLGPFLDSTNGNDNETALTISQADIRLSKNGGAFAQKNDANAATHGELGMYMCALNATDTNTYGILRIVVHEAGALAVDASYIVLAEPVYDSFCPAASGNPLPAFGIIDWGVAQGGSASSLQHRSGLSLGNNVPNGSTDLIYGGTGAGQSRVGHAFTGATDTMDVSPNWTVTPDNTSEYVTFGAAPAPTNAAALPTANLPDAGITAAKFASNAITAAALASDAVTEIQSGLATPAAVADAVWDEPRSGHVAAGSFGEAMPVLATSVRTAVGLASADLDTQLAATSVRAALGLATANLDTQLAALQSDTNDIQTRLPAALVSGRMDVSVGAMAANVITAAATAADFVTEVQAGLATAAAVDAVDNFLDTEMQASLDILNKLDTAMELDGAVYRFTVNALEQAPAGGGGGTTDWTADERTAIRSILGIPPTGTTPADPSAGILDTIRDLVVTADSVIDSVLADTNDIQTRLPAALVGGRMDASVGAMAANVITAAATAADFVTEVQAGLATAAAVDAVDNFVDTEITALATAVATVDTVVDSIKAKTDSLTFTVAGRVDSNMMSANSSDLTGNGTTTPISAV